MPAKEKTWLEGKGGTLMDRGKEIFSGSMIEPTFAEKHSKAIKVFAWLAGIVLLLLAVKFFALPLL